MGLSGSCQVGLSHPSGAYKMKNQFLVLFTSLSVLSAVAPFAEAADTKPASTTGTKCDAKSQGRSSQGFMAFWDQFAGGQPATATAVVPAKGKVLEPKPKLVSILMTSRVVYSGETLSPACITLRSVEAGQVPRDAIKTSTLSHAPYGMPGWQAKYTLAEGTVLSYHALGPGQWVANKGGWSWHGQRQSIARRFGKHSY